MGGRGSSGDRGSSSYTSLNSERESEAFFEDAVYDWKQNLNNREESSISEYTMYNNKDINEYLRDGKISNFEEDELKTQVKDIELGISKFDLKENAIFYRAGASNIDREFKSFVSATTSRAQAESYLQRDADTLYVIQASKGKGKGAYVASVSEVPEEQEFLFNRGLKPNVVNRSTQSINGKKIKVVTIKL